MHEMSQSPNSDLPGQGASFRSSSNYIFERSLRPWWRVIIFLVPVIIGSAWLAYEAVSLAWVTTQVNSVSIIDLQRALSRDPENPELVHRLGLVYSYNPTEINLSESVKYLRHAVILNPRRWECWSDLATTCDFVGDTACADDAFERARTLNPMGPRLQWAIGNHYLLTNHQEKAFPYFRRLLELNTDYRDSIFLECLRATRYPQAIYAHVVPQGKDASVRFAFLVFLAANADYENATRIWEQMFSGPDRTPNLLLLKPFLDFLIEKNQIQDASMVWSDLEHAGAIPPGPGLDAGNLLRDGSFEAQPLNLGFDWHTSDSPNLVYDFSDPSAYEGGKCLRIDFAVGRNAEYNLLGQVVLIKPNTQYQLRAYVRSETLTSDSGPRLRVEEMGCGSCEVRTSDPVLGTTGWHPIDVSILTHAQTQAVRVSLWRSPGKMPPRDITGTVWLDDVRLRPVEAPGPDMLQGRPR
jgi:tetratricopeptide (TPR) repeat protein